ncbi:MAG: glycosyltransferase family 2 protein [Candidatus Krumholzibacteriia bacterium]
MENQIRVAVIVLTMDQRDRTRRCLQSFQAVTSPPLRLVLWDNGSRDDTAALVRREFPAVRVQEHPENLGVAGGRNAAAALAIAEFQPTHLFFIDNDMTVTPGFLHALMRPFAADPRLAQTTGKIRIMGTRRLYGAGGCEVSFWRGRTSHVGHGEEDRGQRDRPGPCIPSGGCMLVRTDVFRELGGFDERFNPYGPEDLDFGLRVRRAGYRALYVPEAVVHHELAPSRTFSGGQYSEQYVRNKTRQWFRFMRAHASPAERAGFLLVSAPWLLARAVVREARQGNLGAVKGMFAGAVDLLRSGK